jgi:site-specific DNA recombinase
MGRLTLNMLLSFAQFEREVTGERIRDKIRASKEKGMWMGGNPPLGFNPPTDLTTRKLVIVEEEANTVRLIFKKYLALKSVASLLLFLDREHITSKSWVSKKGGLKGGKPFQRGSLYYLLSNRSYLGELKTATGYREASHPAIIDPDIFEAVQALLKEQSVIRKARPVRSDKMLLTGKLFDCDGHPLSPTFAYGSKGKLYRYYVSSPLQKGVKLDIVNEKSKQKSQSDKPLRRITAPLLEETIQTLLAHCLSKSPETLLSILLSPVTRIELERSHIHFTFKKERLSRIHQLKCEDDVKDKSLGHISFPLNIPTRGGKTIIETPATNISTFRTPDTTLINALKRGHQIMKNLKQKPNIESKPPPATKIIEVKDNEIQKIEKIKSIETISQALSTYDIRIASLAFLAPDIQKAIIEGRQPKSLTLKKLIQSPIPLSWERQKQQFMC